MDFQFYPTGKRTAARMFTKITTQVTHVCDPSAGRGHLLRYLKEAQEEQRRDWRYRAHKGDLDMGEVSKLDIAHNAQYSAIEIDAQHHPTLKEDEVQILGYDFLQIDSLASVSHVLMNPPFASGARHVLHAWDAVYDAEVIAIVNAETIRNPFSKERQRLVDLIGQHGSVEFFKDEFTDEVERKTDVEIALVYLRKEPTIHKALFGFVEELTKEGATVELGEGSVQACNALALPDNFVKNTVANYKLAVNAMRVAVQSEAIAARLATNLGLTLQEMQADGVGSDVRKSSKELSAETNKEFKSRYRSLKEKAWAQVIRSTLLTDKLSNQARRKLEAQVQSIYTLEFSEANIHGFLQGVVESMGDIYTEMICGLFDNILGRSDDNVVFYKAWKSNEKHKQLGMRIRMSRFIIPCLGSSYSSRLTYEAEQFLADIDKVFGYLDGVTEPYPGLVAAFRQRPENGERYSTRYFDFRFYPKARTVHFYPKNKEVIERLNQFVGKLRRWIPAQWGDANTDFKKQYDEGEKLQEAYAKAFAKAAPRHNRGGSIAYAVMHNTDSDRDAKVAAFSDAVAQAQEEMGIFATTALEGQPEDRTPQLAGEQLLLIAA